MRQHAQRIFTGLVGAPLLIAFVIHTSEMVFSFLIFLLIQVAVWEYNRLAFGSKEYLLEKSSVYIFAAAITIAAYLSNSSLMIAVLAYSFLLSALLFIFQIKAEAIDCSSMGKVVLGFMYMPLLLSSFILMRQTSHGVKWVIFTLTLAFCGDIFGLYFGKLFGKHRLQANLSPGKTVEGTLGLVIGSILGGLLFQHLFFSELPLVHAVIISFFGGILGQLGDLFESALKRIAGVKDAGHIFPGHGGILDRFDSVSFIAPFVHYYQCFLLR